LTWTFKLRGDHFLLARQENEFRTSAGIVKGSDATHGVVAQGTSHAIRGLGNLRQDATRMSDENPKIAPAQDDTEQDNTDKDPLDWVSGDEPMTGAQAPV
jgi:hypothetical protein